MTTTDKCLNPNCNRAAHCRGLCNSCYQVAFSLVKRGKTTWENLESAGKSKPAIKQSPSKATEWLLESDGEST